MSKMISSPEGYKGRSGLAGMALYILIVNGESSMVNF